MRGDELTTVLIDHACKDAEHEPGTQGHHPQHYRGLHYGSRLVSTRMFVPPSCTDSSDH